MERMEIAKRQLEKSKKYNSDNVEEVMDKFFSLYVAYNAMYSKFSQGDNNDDRACATTRMADYLKNENITILNDCESTIKKMLKPVEDGIFYIYGNHSSLDYKKDSVIIQKIHEDINNYRAILNFIYGIRNNMFHGTKQIIAEQVQLINPANIILEKLLDALIQKAS